MPWRAADADPTARARYSDRAVVVEIRNSRRPTAGTGTTLTRHVEHLRVLARGLAESRKWVQDGHRLEVGKWPRRLLASIDGHEVRMGVILFDAFAVITPVDCGAT